MVASVAVLALLSALFQLFLRETHSTRSILTHVSIAVHAQLSVLYLLSHRAESKRQKIIKVQFRVYSNNCTFFILYLAKPLSVPSQGLQTSYTVEATIALQFQLGHVFAWQ